MKNEKLESLNFAFCGIMSPSENNRGGGREIA
jgi:hypothetical protein